VESFDFMSDPIVQRRGRRAVLLEVWAISGLRVFPAWSLALHLNLPKA
jgi:hypothetical protein